VSCGTAQPQPERCSLSLSTVVSRVVAEEAVSSMIPSDTCSVRKKPRLLYRDTTLRRSKQTNMSTEHGMCLS
jgi:hypothetical protein